MRQLLVLALPAVAMAFVGPVVPCRRPHIATSRGVMRMSTVDEKPRTSSFSTSTSPSSASKSESSALVPVNKQNIETTAAIVGTGVGVVLLGPILGVVLGLVSNYVAKTDNDAGEAARGVGKAALELFNYFAKINAKYDVTGKVSDTTKDVVTKIKESSGDDSVISQLEESVSTTSSKLTELNDQYDIVGKAKSAVQLAVELSTAAIDKGIELNDKYNLVDKAGDAVKTAAAKVKDAVDKA